MSTLFGVEVSQATIFREMRRMGLVEEYPQKLKSFPKEQQEHEEKNAVHPAPVKVGGPTVDGFSN